MSNVAQSDESDYSYWHNALAGTFGAVHDGDCQAGFWRKRTSRAGPFVPVAIWHDGSEFVALVDGKPTDAAELWTFVCRHPITEEQYHSRMATGRWHDEDSAVAASLADSLVGHNRPPEDDAAILAAQIDAATANAEEYGTINDDATAAKAQSARARLNELAGQADKKREAEKKPHLEAGRAVDKKWKSIVDKAESAAKAIRDALSAYATRQAKAAAEAARKAAEAEAERQRTLREHLAKHPDAPPAFVEATMVPEPAPVVVQPTQIKGAYGRGAAVKAVKIARVTDYEKAVPFFATNAEVRVLVDKLAQKTVDAGVVPPGVEVTEEMKVQ